MTLSDYLDQHCSSRTAFARTIGVSRQALSRYERGQRRPEWEILDRIATASDGRVMPNDFLSPPAVVDTPAGPAAGLPDLASAPAASSSQEAA